MPRRSRIGMAFCAAIATAVSLGACGSGLPGNAVVQIGKASISQAALDHWLTIANDTGQAQTGAKSPPLPLAPDFTACVKGQQQAAGNTVASRSPTEVAGFKASCQATYGTLVAEVLDYLIPRMWIQGEAVDRHVHVTAAQVEAAYEQERKTSRPPLATTAELNQFLASSGQTVADLRWRTMIDLLGNKIELAVQKQAAKVTTKQIDAYYAKNLKQYTTAETRNIHLVLVTSLATAQKVRSLLAVGQSYATVAAKYSLDPTTKSAGGSMLGVTTAELNSQLSAQVFAAKPGVLSAPVKTAFGYYVFTVDKVNPASTESLAKASASIKATLSQQQVAAATVALTSGLTKKWAPRTQCREGVYQVATFCGNPPKSSTGSSGVAGTG